MIGEKDKLVEMGRKNVVGLKTNKKSLALLNLIRSCRLCTGITPIAPTLPGGLYLGQFSKDSKWYRVEVKTVMKEVEKALVTYVDYGNKEVVSFAR